tara:strand:+ start:158 stop:274 length:117 start_codon:yes stop_codon:yes gene_type:complete
MNQSFFFNKREMRFLFFFEESKSDRFEKKKRRILSSFH